MGAAPAPAPAPSQAASPPPPPPAVERETTLYARQADARLKKEAQAELNKPAAGSLSRALVNDELVIVTGSRARAPQPQPWLEQIDALLKAGREAEARQQWINFRAAYPDHPVPPAMLEHFK